MPGMDGFEFFNQLKQKNKLPAKFILLSGFSIIAENQAIKSGINRVFSKPINVDQLIAELIGDTPEK